MFQNAFLVLKKNESTNVFNVVSQNENNQSTTLSFSYINSKKKGGRMEWKKKIC